jgi:hypothetical protein
MNYLNSNSTSPNANTYRANEAHRAYLLTNRLLNDESLEDITSSSTNSNTSTKNVSIGTAAERPVFSHISEITTVSSSINFGLILLPIIQS